MSKIRKKYYCHKCGKELKIHPKIVLLKYVLFGKNKQYIRCNQCQNISALFIYHNICKDAENKTLKQKNKIKANYYTEEKI